MTILLNSRQTFSIQIAVLRLLKFGEFTCGYSQSLDPSSLYNLPIFLFWGGRPLEIHIACSGFLTILALPSHPRPSPDFSLNFCPFPSSCPLPSLQDPGEFNLSHHTAGWSGSCWRSQAIPCKSIPTLWSQLGGGKGPVRWNKGTTGVGELVLSPASCSLSPMCFSTCQLGTVIESGFGFLVPPPAPSPKVKSLD